MTLARPEVPLCDSYDLKYQHLTQTSSEPFEAGFGADSELTVERLGRVYMLVGDPALRTDLSGLPSAVVFANGFESGDTSRWDR